MKVGDLAGGADTTSAPGEPGELMVRGPITMLGYFAEGLPTPPREVLRGDDGWLRTGDVAVARGEDGYFTIVDRRKDMILTGGYNVYPERDRADARPATRPSAISAVGPIEGMRVQAQARAYVVVKPGRNGHRARS